MDQFGYWVSSEMVKVFQALDGIFEEVVEVHLNAKRPHPEHEDFIVCDAQSAKEC